MKITGVHGLFFKLACSQHGTKGGGGAAVQQPVTEQWGSWSGTVWTPCRKVVR